MSSKRFSTETRSYTELQVINRIGRVVYSSNVPEVAQKWARENIGFHGELEVQEVISTTTTTRRRVYRPNPKEAGPGMPELGFLTQPRKLDPDCDAGAMA